MKTINDNNGTVTITANYGEVAVLQLALSKLIAYSDEKEVETLATRLLHEVSNPEVNNSEGKCAHCNNGILDVNNAWHGIGEAESEKYVVCSLACLAKHTKRRQAIRDYLYQYVHPAQLPEWVEEILLDYNYSPEQLDEIKKELREVGYTC
ncbi:hypothetical protein [Virgibacillus proomii]|uniref:hypothetical protein n=1 Tax=Virgibacillus proomii TaxID=84407 RepID=UPI001C1067BD|nr:hypothetical protein [Virgibacillus proomii]MBU5265721.1 hypothetical protein [Virgibacillus proomii]